MATQTSRPLPALGRNQQPYIGRRTGKVINIAARKDVHGYENVNDYFPDSDSGDEETVSKNRTVTENNVKEASQRSQMVSRDTASENNGPTSDEETSSRVARSTTSDNGESEWSPDSAIGSNKEDDEAPPATSNVNHEEIVSDRNISPQISSTVVDLRDEQSTVLKDEDFNLQSTKKRLKFSPCFDTEEKVKGSQVIQKRLPSVQNEEDDGNTEEKEDEEDEYIIVEKPQTKSSAKKRNTRSKKGSQSLVESDNEAIVEDKRKSNDTFLTLKKKMNITVGSNLDSYNSSKGISMQSVKPSTSKRSKIPVRKIGKVTQSRDETPKRNTSKRKAQEDLEPAIVAKKATTVVNIPSSVSDSKINTRAHGKPSTLGGRASKRSTNQKMVVSFGEGLDETGPKAIVASKRKANNKKSSESVTESSAKTATVVVSARRRRNEISESEDESGPETTVVPVPSVNKKGSKKKSSERDDESGPKTKAVMVSTRRRKNEISESEGESGPKTTVVPVPSLKKKGSKKKSSERDDESGPKTKAVMVSTNRKTNEISESEDESGPKTTVVPVPSVTKKARKKKSSKGNEEPGPKTKTVMVSTSRKANEISESEDDSDPKSTTVVPPAKKQASKKNSSKGNEESIPKTTTAVMVSTRRKTHKKSSESDDDSDPKSTTVVVSAKKKTSKKNSESGPVMVSAQKKKTYKQISESNSESSDEISSTEAKSRVEKDDDVDEYEIEDENFRSDVGAEVMVMDERDDSVEESSDDGSVIRAQAIRAGKLELKRNSSELGVDAPMMEEGPRRSNRNRVPPLQYWKNERINYERRMSGWVIKDVIVNPSPRMNTRKRKTTTKPTTHKAKKGPRVDVSVGVQEDWELNQSNISEDLEEYTNPIGAVINPDTMKEVKMKILHSSRMLDFQPPVGTDGADAGAILMHKYFSHGQFGAGQILLRPGAEKGRQHVRRDTMIFHILSGRVMVSIHNHSFVLARGSSFFVPEGNVYNIKNLETNRDACLFFTQLKA